MRTIGFVLIFIGLVTVYLGAKGKIGAALSAFITGQVPNMENVPPSAQPGAPSFSSPPGLKGPSGQITVPKDPYSHTGGISQ